MAGLDFQTSFSDITGAIQGLVGSSSKATTSGTGKTTGKVTTTQTEGLNISQEGIDKLIRDVLAQSGGLADVFSTENVAGIFDSSVAAQAAGDIATQLVGELAKLTATKTATNVAEQEQTTEQAQGTKQKSGGILGQIGKLFKF